MRRLVAALLLLTGLVAGACRVAAEVLVALGEPWRFTNAPSIPSNAAWVSPTFDDAPWPSAPSGFGSSQYGEQTSFANAPGDWRTVLFRKAFVATNAPGTGTLVLRIDWRDGLVAFLNGREITRRGLPGAPGSPVSFDTMPASRFNGSAEDIRIGPARDWLVQGTNVLAFQVHSDSDFERPVLVPELVVDLLREPYLQVSGSNQMTLSWRLADPVPARVVLAAEDGPEQVVSLAAAESQSAVLPGLVPGKTHRYSLVAVPPGQPPVVVASGSFRALPPGGRARLALLGDSGSGLAGQFAVARALAREDADVVLHAGDVIYPGFAQGLTDTRLFSVYRRQMARVPFMFAWGNHDLYYGAGPMRSVIRPPLNNTPAEDHKGAGTFPESYYSFDVGPVHVVVLYQPVLSQYAFTNGSPQHRWLDADLAATVRPWKVVVAHHPVATSGGHRFTDYNANGRPDWEEFSEVLLPIARQHGVQFFLSGHDHVFERFLPRDGLNVVVSGGGGTHLYWLRGFLPDSAQFAITHHHLRLTFDEAEADVRAILPDGTELDGFGVRRLPFAGDAAAARGTPVVEDGPATNGDGNRTGQLFEFGAAQPIPAVAGPRANLGRLRVLLDDTHLHLGMERMILPPDHDACLFVGFPGAPGAASLAGLGNGIPDPAGEAVDALDAMENLAFKDFAPALALVAGDEFADGTQRAFRRPGHAVGHGQGVFRLAPGLPSVPGARLQQFHRSPQDNAFHPEQNADFVEASIPRAELPTIVPGGFILVAAIAAGPADPVRQTRFIDPGWIGARLASDGHGPALLEPVRVRIPPEGDADADGLPDAWEARHQLSSASGDGADGPDGDPDDDGFPNRTEWAVGASPRSAGEPVFRVHPELPAQGAIRLRWPAPSGTIDLQQATSVHGPWRSVEGFPRPGIGPVDEATLPIASEALWFRLRRP